MHVEEHLPGPSIIGGFTHDGLDFETGTAIARVVVSVKPPAGYQLIILQYKYLLWMKSCLSHQFVGRCSQTVGFGENDG